MDEKTLINQLKNKNQDALYTFIDEYGRVLKGVISKTLWKYPELWDEALNDAMLSIWENIEYYDSSRSSFKNWCAAVSKYRAIDLLRKEVRYETSEIEENQAYSDSQLEDKLEIEEILAILPEKDSQLFRQIFIEGRTYEESAKDLGLSKDNAYKRVSRSRKFLRRWRGGKL